MLVFPLVLLPLLAVFFGGLAGTARPAKAILLLLLGLEVSYGLWYILSPFLGG